MASSDEYTIPLQDQQAFGAGIKKRKVKFVPEKSSVSSIPSPISGNASDRYLSIVLGKQIESQGGADPLGLTKDSEVAETSISRPYSITARTFCDVCKLQVHASDMPSSASSSSLTRHEASLAHQVCIEHSHPPSHLDRGRQGLKYLTNYGWDPDKRLCLGVEGSGIRFPLVAKKKSDTLGVGADTYRQRYKKVETVKDKTPLLDAGRIRKKAAQEKKNAQLLRDQFYGREDLGQYS